MSRQALETTQDIAMEARPWPVADRQLGPRLLASDAVSLVGAAFLARAAVALFTQPQADPIPFTAFAVVLTFVTLALAGLGGAYHPGAAQRPGRVARALAPVWIGFLPFAWLLLAELPIEIDLARDGLVFYALIGPAAFVLQRHAFARALRRAGLPGAGTRGAQLNAAERACKRGFDLVVAGALFVLLAPLLVVIALLVRLTSEGPALFKQTRSGLHGRPFAIYKFRTMTVQENGAAIVQAQRGDARVTPVGRFLRRSSLDELPQLLNVLKGDMSLIGPRPHALSHDREFALRVADYPLRHHVKPGITGWAQVCGYRGETRTDEALARRIELDLHYIERWSLWLDLWIMIRTCRAVIAPQNAY